MKKAFFLTAICLATLVAISCKNEKRPDGMPDIYPCSLKIIQDSQPLPDAQVRIASSDPQIARFPCGGTSDQSGVVELKTMGFKGAPRGTFKVVVSKIEWKNRPSNAEEARKYESEGIKEESYDLVDRKFADASTTPLEIEIQEGVSSPIEIDVGSAVHVSREDLMR